MALLWRSCFRAPAEQLHGDDDRPSLAKTSNSSVSEQQEDRTSTSEVATAMSTTCASTEPPPEALLVTQPKLSLVNTVPALMLKSILAASNSESAFDALHSTPRSVRLSDEPDLNVFPPQELLKGLKIRDKLSAGSFASVFKGEYGGAEVAIKVIITDEKEVGVRIKESLLPVRLSHPAIVQTYLARTALATVEFCNQLESQRQSSWSRHSEGALSVDYWAIGQCGVMPGQYITVLAMNFCKQGTLLVPINYSVFRAHPRGKWPEHLGLRALLRTAIEMANGCAYLHSVGIVHGDLKPGNVLLEGSMNDARGFTAKLTDFGLSHVLATMSQSLHTGTWGTPNYMAPEHMEGRVTRQTDIYSFGMCLLHMMVGSLPYEDLAVGTIVRDVSCGALRPPWPDSFSFDGLLQLGKRCTAFRPEDRPSDFASITEELLAIEAKLRVEVKMVAAAQVARDSNSSSRQA